VKSLAPLMFALSLGAAAGELPSPAVAPAPAQAKSVSAADAVDGVAVEPTSGKLEPVDVVEHLNQRIPGDLRFLDAFQNGFFMKDAFERKLPTVLTLVYFDCPMLCNLVEQGLVKGLGESGLKLGTDYQALTVSFSPKDSPREASIQQESYLRPLRGAEKAHAQDWLFLTGATSQIKGLAEAIGFQYRWDAPTAQFEHPAVAVILTSDGRISRYLYGVQFPPRDLRLAVVEASEGKVGTTLDRVLLKCFRYDPSSRRYNFYVWAFVRTGAGLVFIALTTLLTVLWRRDLKAQKGKAA
jgi:protein SCO1/2